MLVVLHNPICNIYIAAQFKNFMEGYKKMTEIETILTLIGEFVYTEIDDVNKVDYINENNELTYFAIVMGKRQKIRLIHQRNLGIKIPLRREFFCRQRPYSA